MAKTQTIRLLDVFVFGPVMILAATKLPGENLALALAVIGVGTIVFNGVNYLEVRNQ